MRVSLTFNNSQLRAEIAVAASLDSLDSVAVCKVDQGLLSCCAFQRTLGSGAKFR
uniref:Uncharacterized protein n=1 Tax=Anguilla anguilla TaxID=7936 RepID=A0A0E9SP93_ANGAN